MNVFKVYFSAKSWSFKIKIRILALLQNEKLNRKLDLMNKSTIQSNIYENVPLESHNINFIHRIYMVNNTRIHKAVQFRS